MIYTVTLNPAIDYVIKVDNFETGIVNRTKQENMFFGGKGINVSNVLKTLGEKSTALGFILSLIHILSIAYFSKW